MNSIIISAYAVSPLRGSESAVGWNIAKGLSQYFKVYLIYCKEAPNGIDFHFEICQWLNETPLENLVLVPVEMPFSSKLPMFLHDRGIWPFYYLAYNLWQKAAYKAAKIICGEFKIDLLYQLNYIGFREPGYLWKLDKPIIWGPTNGFHSVPLKFYSNFRFSQIIAQYLKFIFNELQILSCIRPRKLAKKAALVYCVDKIANNVISNWGGNTKILQETGLSPDYQFTTSPRKNKRLELVWSGNITTGKALNFLLQALSELKLQDEVHLTVIGDGPEKFWLQRNFSSLNSIITWVGWVSKEKATSIVKEKDVFVHTSLKEGTPHVILEALSYGLPVICHDTCGMSEVVNNSIGYLVPYVDSKTTIATLKKLIWHLKENPNEISLKRINVLANNKNLTWDRKVGIIANDIKSIITKQNVRNLR